MIEPADIEAIERATLEAVAPEALLEFDGWLVGLDPGSIRRAASAAPLRHELTADAVALDRIEAAYQAQGLLPAFRLADRPGLEAMAQDLTRRGYVSEQPTLVMVADIADVLTVTDQRPAEVTAQPEAAWASVFLSEGFDPVDGADRVRALTRLPDARFGQVIEGGRTVAVGCGSYSHGWASFHGMRTDMIQRGKGYAGRVLAGLAAEAEARGIRRAFLQVEEKNTGAQSLYRRAGFEVAWRYFYWSRRVPSINARAR